MYPINETSTTVPMLCSIQNKLLLKPQTTNFDQNLITGSTNIKNNRTELDPIEYSLNLQEDPSDRLREFE